MAVDKEREQVLDQFYSVGHKREEPKVDEPAAEAAKLAEAKEILQAAREYVYKATVQRDTFAYPILARLDKFLAEG